MKLDGTRSFAAPRETVWEVLNDPARMAELMPGVESFDVQDERNWRANVKIPLGLGGLRMSIHFQKTEERRPEFARLHAKGQGVGALMNMETAFHLGEEAAGTAMRWEADVRIAGPVGSMGQRVLQPIVNQQVKNVLDALDKQVMAAAGPEAVPEPVAGTSPTPPPGDTGEPGTGGPSASEGGQAGAPDEPSPEAEAPPTDPELKDYGPPAESTPEADASEVEGSSGAEEGIHEWAPEAYDEEPEGPTTSTEDSP